MKCSPNVPALRSAAKALRCRSCAKLLALARPTFEGDLDIRCSRCKTDNQFSERRRAPSETEGAACPARSPGAAAPATS